KFEREKKTLSDGTFKTETKRTLIHAGQQYPNIWIPSFDEAEAFLVQECARAGREQLWKARELLQDLPTETQWREPTERNLTELNRSIVSHNPPPAPECPQEYTGHELEISFSR